MQLNFHATIDLTKTLRNIGCTLKDIVDVYKIYFDKLHDIEKETLIRCDKIITHLGFDKNWSNYYHYSRKNLHNSYQKDNGITKFEKSNSVEVKDE